MSHPIRDRVHLIELPLGPTRTVNAVLIDGDPLTLVDTGLKTPESLAALERGFAEHGLKLSDLEQIVITHPHNDHFGAAAELARRSGARVIGDGAAVTAAFPESFRPNTEMRVSYFEEAGAPDEVASFWRQRRSNLSDNTEAVEMATELADGDTVRMGGADWQVVSTPGHAETSISLYQPDARLLIAGDILIGNAGASVTLHAMPRPGRWLLQIFDSLDRLSAIDAERAFPGHGPVIEDAGRVIPVRRQRAAQRLDEVAGMVRERPLSAFQLSTTIYPPPIGTNFMGLSQSIGYLEALVCQERARSEVRAGIREYEPS